MASRARNLYYVEGSTVRKREVDPIPRRREPERAPKRRRSVNRKAAIKAENSKGFDLRYLVVLSVMFVLMIASCVIMLMVQSSVESREKKIESLQQEIQTLQADNAAYENSLNNMYSLEDIYTIATGELGMIYSQNGQIIYYDNSEDDYVKQYGDVPATVD